MIELAVVIPVFNENEIILEVIGDWSRILQSLSISYSINAYNDGSTDNTLEKLAVAQQQFPHVQVINNVNKGHGPTILQGYLDNLNAQWIFQVDSDNEITAENFIEFWKNRNDYDLVIGNRKNRSSPFVRRVITLLSNFTVYVWYGGGVYDVNVPYRLMRTERFNEILKTMPANTFAPNIIIAGMAVRKKLAVKNIHIPNQNRKTGEVSLKKIKLLKAAIKSFYQTISYATKN